MVTKVWFLSKVFWDFEKWTKKMSKNEFPKKLCPKSFEEKNKLKNLLKDELGRPKKAGIFSQPIFVILIILIILTI